MFDYDIIKLYISTDTMFNSAKNDTNFQHQSYCGWLITFGLSNTLYMFSIGVFFKEKKLKPKWPRAKIWFSLVWFVLRYDLSLCTPSFVLQTVFGFGFLLSDPSVRPLWFHSVMGSVFKSTASHNHLCSSLMEENGVNGSWQSQELSAVSTKD